MNIFDTIFQTHKILLALGFLCLSNLYAQVGLSNYNQTPMLIHPSLVGSSGERRASVAYGRNDVGYYVPSPLKEQAYYGVLYYDQMLKKWGSGIGGYLNLSKTSNKAGLYGASPYSTFREHSFATGVAIAPKYTIMKKKNPGEVRFTWSPSISLNYNYEYLNYDNKIPNNNSSGITPDTSYEQYRVNDFTTSLGGMLNSKVLMLGLMLNYELKNIRLKNFNMQDHIFSPDTIYKPYNHILSTTAVIGFSLPRRENSLLGFSYTSKLTIMLNKAKEDQLFIKPFYGNINLRVWKILLGTSIATSPIDNANSIYIGYKAKKWKATLGVSNNGGAYRFAETTLMYNF